MSTIYKIAEKAGLSPSTVARALSGKGYCSKQSKDLVYKVARELNYTPVQAAKTLKSRITNKIMLTIPDLLNPFYFGMIKGVNTVLEKHDYHCILSYSGHCEAKELQLVGSLCEMIVDGMIIISFDFAPNLVKAISKAAVPIVTTNPFESIGQYENLDSVYVDQIMATYIATEHLIVNGHNAIAYIGGEMNEQTGKERFLGYKKCLEDHGIPLRRDFVYESDYSRTRTREMFLERLGRKIDYTGVVIANNLMAIGFIDACRENGIRIYDDISLISLDDTDLCTCSWPHITSVDMREEQIGSNAAELIMERVKHKRKAQKIVRIEPHIIPRGTVKKLNGAKREL